MSNAILKLLLIDSDSIYRTGLRVLLEEFADIAVVAEADSETLALQILETSDRTSVDLVILASNTPSSQNNQILALIESILLSIPIPPIFVSEDSNGVWELVDGLQRVSSFKIFDRDGINRKTPERKSSFILT